MWARRSLVWTWPWKGAKTSDLILVRYANVRLGQLGHLRETQTASGLLRQKLENQADQADRELMARSANFPALQGGQPQMALT